MLGNIRLKPMLVIGTAAIGLTTLMSCSRPAVPAPDEATTESPSESTHVAQGSPADSDWQREMERILASPRESGSPAPALFAAMPKLPVQAIRQYLPQALDVCTDEEFVHAEKIYFQSGMPRFVAESIFDDALNRPDEIKLSLLAKTVMTPDHPMAPQARELLEVYLDLTPGNSPSVSWDVAVQRYLDAEN